ncbi:MAG: RNA-directed DNA polymerase [Candidatus Moranbacteria bacterium]|nr:RNA-directed DNA polymerase [Candidatus Moranbacteria bacterium]
MRKFFANIDHEILIRILQEYIPDKNIIWLLESVIESFSSENEINIGLPLGNLTSQLFVNIYMNKFDQFVQHRLKLKYYIRYADDFVIFSEDKKYLENNISIIREFLKSDLKLELHPDKVYIKTLNSGVDKYLENNLISEESFNQSRQSYLGMLKYCRGYKIQRKIKEIIPAQIVEKNLKLG